MAGKNDLANYRKMCEPYPDNETADANLSAFFDAVEKARKEYGVMDVHIIVKVNILQAGEECLAMANAHFGNTLEAAGMCAWSLGKEQEEKINALIGKNMRGVARHVGRK